MVVDENNDAKGKEKISKDIIKGSGDDDKDK